MSRRDIPRNMRLAQLWGAQADVDVAGNVAAPTLIRVQLDAEYERDWTVHLAAAAYQTGAPLLAGLAPSSDNTDVIVTYGGGRGVANEIWLDYPTRGATFGVRGCSVTVSLRNHARTGAAKAKARLGAEIVDAVPPSLSFEALPTWTGDAVELPAIGTKTVVPIPPRAVGVLLGPPSYADSVAKPYEVRQDTGSLQFYVGRGGTAGTALTAIGDSSPSQFFALSRASVALELYAIGGAAQTLVPVWRIQP